MERVHFADSVCRGRDYYTPYRALLPVGVEQLLVAGRHYSATPSAQKVSREIPPCMAMGEAAGSRGPRWPSTAAPPFGTWTCAGFSGRCAPRGRTLGTSPAANARVAETEAA